MLQISRAGPRLLGLALIALGSQAAAQTAAPRTDAPPAPPSAPTCRYGDPVANPPGAGAAKTQLIAKVCLHRSGAQRLIRHSLELRAVPTGARLQQASLPAAPTTTDALPAPATVLPGTPALLVLPHGIAAADLRLGSAEMVFEAQGQLVGAAREGDLLALVEALPAAGRPGSAQFEWTVLDLEAGQLIGQAVLAAARVDFVALRRDKGIVFTEVQLSGPKGSRLLRADVLGADGKPVPCDGQLVVRTVTP